MKIKRVKATTIKVYLDDAIVRLFPNFKNNLDIGGMLDRSQLTIVPDRNGYFHYSFKLK